MDRPYSFTDSMLKGSFHSFTHHHTFSEENRGTWMKEKFFYKPPLGFMGIWRSVFSVLQE